MPLIKNTIQCIIDCNKHFLFELTMDLRNYYFVKLIKNFQEQRNSITIDAYIAKEVAKKSDDIMKMHACV